MHPQRASAFKKASLKGWEYVFSNMDEAIDLILDKYNTQNKTREALIFEADKLRELAYYKTDKIGKIDNSKIKEIYNIYKKLGWIENSIDLNRFIFREDDTAAALFTEKETAYLKQKREITVCGHKDYEPYINFSGEKPLGLIPELIDAYSNIIGIPIKYVKTDNWNDCQQKCKSREIDMADVILKNHNTYNYFTTSKTYISDFLVLVTKVEKPYISGIADADKMNVAIVGAYKNMIQHIKKQYPNLHLTYVKDLKEGLKKLSRGHVDAYLGAFMPTAFRINKQYIKELKINGRFNELKLEGGIGIRNDEPLLAGIFNKAIDALDPAKKREITNSWISVKQENEFDGSLLWKIVLAVIALLLIFGYRQLILKGENSKLQEKTLKLSHQALIIEQITDSLISTDLDGYIMNWNVGSEMLLGYSPDEIIGKHISILYRQEDVAALEENIKILMQTGKLRTEVHLLKKSTEIVPAALSLSLLRDENGVPLRMVGYTHDLTQQKKSEEILQKLNNTLEEQKDIYKNEAKRFQDILNQIPEIAIQGYDERHKVLYWNHASEDLYGYSYDEALGRRIEDLIIPDTMRGAVNDAISNWVSKDIKIPSAEIILKDKNNRPVNVFSQHVLIETARGKKEMYSLDIDLHHIKETEEKLKQSEKALQALNADLEKRIESATIDLKKSQKQAKLGSWKFDIVNNHLSWSDETYHIFEYPKTSEMASYEDFLAAIHPDDIEKVNRAYTKSLETQEPYEILHRLLMKDGRVKYVREHCETTFDSVGNALVSIGTIQDITSQHLAEEKLREKKDMLFKQSRLAQMGEMISMIAHQWRQPLSAISATTNALILINERGRYESELFEDRLQKIADYSQHLSATIDDFRNFFKTNKEKEETTIEAIIKDVLNITQTSLENKNINLITDFKYHKKVNIYGNEFKQVLLNLIKNAEDILLEKKIVDPEITLRTFEENGYPVLTVEDNGGGIDNAIIDKIFDPYFSTKLDKEGTGLGLYMSKVIIQEHCTGMLSVKNSHNGAIFRIEMRSKDI